MTRLKFLLPTVILISITSSVVSQTSTTLASYKKARLVLDQAMEAIGGAERWKGIKNIVITYHGQRRMINQSLRPQGPLDIEPASGKTMIDFANNRILAEIENHYPGNEIFAYRWTLGKSEGFIIDLKKNNQGNEAVKLSGDSLKSAQSFFRQHLPICLLLEARDQAASLRWLGNSDRSVMVSYVEPDKNSVTLYVDSDSHLIKRVDFLQDDAVLGDTVNTIIFPSYRMVNGLQVPSGRIEKLNETVYRQLEYDVKVDVSVQDQDFTLPTGYVMPAAASGTPPVRKLSDGVFLETGTNVMFVDFKDFVFVTECPNDSATAQNTISTIHKTLPGKPIRYMTFTHHHADHAGGLREYINEQTTILTTPGNRQYVEAMASAIHTIKPDSLSQKPRKPVVETFEKKRVLTEGDQIVELYNIGPTPHVEELVLVYLPRHKILYQADLFFIPATGEVAPAIGVTKWLAKKLTELRLEFTTVIDPDGRVGTYQEFQEALKKGWLLTGKTV